MRAHTLHEILSIGAAREFPKERREALWREISAALPEGEADMPSPLPVKSREPGMRRFVVLTLALLLCAGLAPFADLWRGEVFIADEPPPLSGWEDGLITPEGPGLALPPVTEPGLGDAHNGLRVVLGSVVLALVIAGPG